MARLLFGLLLFITTQGSFAQEETPPLIGPVVYGQPISGPIVFQDLGSSGVWEVDAEALIQTGYIQSWSPNGCYALYGNPNSQQYALIDVHKRTIDRVDLPLGFDEEDLSIAGKPQWSPDGRRLAYGVFDGANTVFVAYDLLTEETEVLYTREDFDYSMDATIEAWPLENTLVYSAGDQFFEVDLATGEVEYLLPDARINIPSYPPFSYLLRSPNNEAIAVFFSLAEARSIRDIRFSYNNQEEIEAMDQVIVERPGIEVYVIDTGETFTFDLDGQIVSAAVWSMDGARLAILTWPGDDYETANGAYIYDFRTNTILPVDGLHPVRHTDPGEYGFFQPSWSVNGEWVTLFGLEQGWVAYKLDGATITRLAEPFQDSISVMRVPFSPVTNYELGACN